MKKVRLRSSNRRRGAAGCISNGVRSEERKLGAGGESDLGKRKRLQGKKRDVSKTAPKPQGPPVSSPEALERSAENACPR